MARARITEDEILALLEANPEGLSLAEFTALVHYKRFPAGIMGRLIEAGKVITVGHNVHGEGDRLSYRHRLSAAEWLRRQS